MARGSDRVKSQDRSDRIFLGADIRENDKGSSAGESIMTEETYKGESSTRKRVQLGPDFGPWTKIPSKLFGSGTAAKLGQSASLMYLALCEHANRNTSNSFKASDRALASETGLSTRTISDIRKRLIENGLFTCVRGEGQSFTYTMLRQSFNWLPLAERPRPRKKPRALSALRLKKMGPL